MTINTATTFRVVTTRKITKTECNWLDADVAAGTLLELRGDPYGCCRSGYPVGYTGQAKYFEIPADAVIGIDEDATASYA